MGREPLWCEDCGQSHMGDCPVHGPLLKVRDKIIPTRARLTLPHYLMLKELELRTANQQVLGVFARKLIQQRTQFGPFIAPKVPKLESLPLDNRLIFKVFRFGIEVATLDLSNEDACSWMMFVRTASTFEEQNLVAYQFNEEVYFATCKPVSPHAELKVWYASDYAKIMNVQLLCGEAHDDSSSHEHHSLSMSHVHVSHETNSVDVKELVPLPPVQDNNNNKDGLSYCEPWKCSTCNQMFGTFSLLEQHSCESRRAKRGRCRPNLHSSLRKRPFTRQTRLTSKPDHVNVAANLTIKQESPCGRDSPAASRPRTRKDPPTFACRLCPKVFLNADKLKTHGYMHTGERPFRCTNTDCSKAFISKYKLLRHMTTHSPMKVHICSYCDKKFHRKDHLKNHLQTHDPHKVSFRCGDCGKMYNTKPGYKKHVALHAAASGELTCKICDKEFASTQDLLEHIKLHSGKSNGAKEKKHRCEHCDRQFYTRKDVRRHMVVHTGRKDFLCQACGQRFGRKDHLVRHTRKSHDSSEQLRVKLGEHLESVGSATVQQMLDMQQFQNQLHLPQQQQQESLTSIIAATAVTPSSSSSSFTELLRIPPVPRFTHKMAPSSPAKPRVISSKMLLDPGLEVGGSLQQGDTLPSTGAVDLGQLLGFLPIQHQSHAPPPTPPITLTPTSPPNALLPHSPNTICHLPQQQQPHAQQHHSFHTHGQRQSLQPLPPTPSTLDVNHAMERTSSIGQDQYLQSALPRFHQAFQ